MFADVRAQRQWVVSRAVLADGRVVDLVRGGAPVETPEPAGGFMSLPHPTASRSPATPSSARIAAAHASESLRSAADQHVARPAYSRTASGVNIPVAVCMRRKSRVRRRQSATSTPPSAMR